MADSRVRIEVEANTGDAPAKLGAVGSAFDSLLAKAAFASTAITGWGQIAKRVGGEVYDLAKAAARARDGVDTFASGSDAATETMREYFTALGRTTEEFERFTDSQVKGFARAESAFSSFRSQFGKFILEEIVEGPLVQMDRKLESQAAMAEVWGKVTMGNLARGILSGRDLLAKAIDDAVKSQPQGPGLGKGDVEFNKFLVDKQEKQAREAAARAKDAQQRAWEAAQMQLEVDMAALDEAAALRRVEAEDAARARAMAAKAREGLRGWWSDLKGKQIEAEKDEERRLRKRAFDEDEEFQGLLGGDPVSGRKRAIQGAQQTAQKDFEDGRRNRAEVLTDLQRLNSEMDELNAKTANTEMLTASMGALGAATADAIVAFASGADGGPTGFFRVIGEESKAFALSQAKLHFAASLGALAFGNFPSAAQHGAAAAGFLAAGALLGGVMGKPPEPAKEAAKARPASARESSSGGYYGSSGGARGGGSQGPSTVNIYVAGDALDEVSLARKVARGMARGAQDGTIGTVDVGGATTVRLGG